MEFKSLLFPEGYPKRAEMPPYFHDLHLDRIVNDITRERDEYNLKPLFYTSLRDPELIKYRQEIASEIEKPQILHLIKGFSNSINKVREYLKRAEQSHYQYQKERWILDGASIYCQSVITLKKELEKSQLRARGFLDFIGYISSYVKSQPFTALLKDTKETKDALSSIKYALFIKENKIKVQRYNGEKDYGEEILSVFERFKAPDAEEIHIEVSDSGIMNHIEAKILELVARLYPKEFSMLENFYSKHKTFMDSMIISFEREAQFYVAYIEYIQPLEDMGLHFCYPDISDKDDILNRNGFDIALAHTIMKQNKGRVVPNDFDLKNGERIFIITGPNQGGKTTFARAFGQIHYLFSLGLKVPGSESRLPIFDRIYTHFEREETTRSLRGKLEDELIRMKEILDKATGDSIIIMNESFSSTSLEDALFLASSILKQILDLDAVGLFVTFMYELSRMDKRIVSLTSTVRKDDVTQRTYKIIRRMADGISYALSIANKHCLTYNCLINKLKKRLDA